MDFGTKRSRTVAAVAAVCCVAPRVVPPYVVDHDCAWYLDVAARVLDGQRLYVDVVDLNPPLVVWANCIPVLLARATGVSVVLAFQLCVLVLLGLCAWLTIRALRRSAERAATLLPMPALLAFALVVVPGTSFGQRDPLAFAMLLPYAALVGTRANAAPRFAEALAIGLLAGLAVALKPFVGFAVLLLVGTSLRRLWTPENLALTATLAAYAVHIVWLPSDMRAGFFATLQLAQQSYGAYEASLTGLLRDRDVLAAAGLGVLCAAAFVSRRVCRSDVAVAFCLLQLGLVASAFWQQKGWHYHFAPAIGAAAVAIPVAAVTLAGAAATADAFAIRFGIPLVLALAGSIRTAEHVLHRDADGRVRVTGEFGELTPAVRVLDELSNGGPVLVLDTSLWPHYPMLLYAGLASTSRHGCLWMLPHVYGGGRAEREASDEAGDAAADRAPRDAAFRYHAPDERPPQEQGVLDELRADWDRRPPSLVVVRDAPTVFRDRRFDFVAWLRGDPGLRERFDRLVPRGGALGYRFFSR